ncbi:MAG: hypothetical protein P1U47_02545 [Zhongshania sp.]|uniref:hypothetical protein n=1 Tax=Zhongshania sp. TaxID=1971902 RepID=UPI002635736D|nr:hypothetical protein [Zhongshania sp.]MDF1691225.1 hypothetical protein [Zhongshania sp.]
MQLKHNESVAFVKILTRNLSGICWFVAVLLLPVTAHAADLAVVKAEALNFYSQSRLAARNNADEGAHKLHFYIAHRAENLALQSVRLSIDGREIAKYNYSEQESKILFDGGVHPLLALNLSAGRHQLAAKFVVLNREAGPNADRLSPSITQEFTLTANKQLELELISDGLVKWLEKPSITVHDRGVENVTENSDSNPLLRAVYFNAQRHYAFEALADAMYFVKQGGSVAQFSPRLQQALRQSVFELGLPAVPSELAGMSGLTAEHTNDDIYRKYNSGVELLNRGQHSEGLAILTALSNGESQRNDEIILRDKINLALGFHFLQQGDSEQSVSYFSKVRRLGPYANKALVGLGWALLSPRQTAVNSLPEKDTMAPGSNAKGMAYLWSGSEDDIAWARRHTPFRRAWAIASGAKEEDLQAAMVPWMELINRDPLDPAVQEGLLILPYAMSHWAGQGPRAETYYVSAVSRLQESLMLLDSAAADIHSGGLRESVSAADKADLSGWDIWLCDLSADRQGAYLDLLLDSARFHIALREFRQLGRIRSVLTGDERGDSVAALAGRRAALIQNIDELSAQWGLNLDQTALAEINKYRLRTERYLAEANFAMARNHENTRRQMTEVVWDGEANR